MFGMSMAEIGVILVLALVILGPEKLPEVARTIGKTLREVRKAGNMLRDAIMIEEPPKKARTAHQLNPSTIQEEIGYGDFEDHDAYDYDYHESHHDTYAHDPHGFAAQRHDVDLAAASSKEGQMHHVDLSPALASLDAAPFDEHSIGNSRRIGDLTQVYVHDQLPEVQP